MDILQTLQNVSLPLPNGPPDDIYYKIENFLAALYLVRPSRTMCERIEDVPNFFFLVIKIGPILFVVEYFLLMLQGKRTYRWNDSIIGMGSLLIGAIPLAFIEAAWFSLYAWLWERFRIIDLPYDSMWTWLLCIPAMELSNYAAHRATHEFNIMWASHQLHHTTQELAFTAGIRFTFLDKFLIGLNCMPWAFLLPPGPAKAHHALNLVYQFWVHTESIPDLGPIEWIFFTPTQHSIHHGVNRFCIDKNYGGFLNIWDQIFGTMVWPKDHKNEKIYYGLTKPVKTWDILYLYTYPFRDIYKRVKKYDKFTDKLGVFFKGPGWEPGKPRLGNYEEIPEDPKDTYELYDKTSPWYMYLYCILHIALVWHMSIVVVERFWILPTQVQLFASLFVAWTVVNMGYILEHKYYAPALEFMRCTLFYVVEILLASAVFAHFPAMAMTAVRAMMALTVLFWTFNFNFFTPKSKIE